MLIFTGHLGLLRCSNIYNINASLWQKKESSAHIIDGLGHEDLGLQPVLLGHEQVAGVHQGAPPPQDLHHQLAGPHREEEAGPSPAEGVAREEVRVEASLVQNLLQLGCELPVVDVLVGPVGEGWGIWWGGDPLLEQRHVPKQIQARVVITGNRYAHVTLPILVGLGEAAVNIHSLLLGVQTDVGPGEDLVDIKVVVFRHAVSLSEKTEEGHQEAAPKSKILILVDIDLLIHKFQNLGVYWQDLVRRPGQASFQTLHR